MGRARRKRGLRFAQKRSSQGGDGQPRRALRRAARTADGPSQPDPVFAPQVCAARALNAAGQSRVTLSLPQARLKAACRHEQEGKGPESASKTMKINTMVMLAGRVGAHARGSGAQHERRPHHALRVHAGPSSQNPAFLAPRSVRRRLLTLQVNPGSRYRCCGKRG